MPPKQLSIKEKSVIKTEKSTLKKSKSVTKTDNSKTQEKSKRAPTTYQIFMKEEIEKLKTTHPTLEHKEKFSMVAQKWSEQKKINSK
mgnify:CR=1 FL=1